MAISISRYVDITSAVLGTAAVATRQLSLNLFTVNSLVPPQSYLTFNTMAEVGSYFGTTSEEYYRASTNYFNWVSKNGTTPTLIQFTRWVPVAVPAYIFGYGADTSTSDWASTSNGYIGLTIGSETHNVGPIDFSSVTLLGSLFLLGTLVSATTHINMSSTLGLTVGMSVSGTNVPSGSIITSIVPNSNIVLNMTIGGFSNTDIFTFGANESVSGILQTAIQAAGISSDWTQATVTYAGNNFQLTGGVVGAEGIAVQIGVGGTDISGGSAITGKGNIGWLPQSIIANGVFTPGAIWSIGSAAETISQTLTSAANANNNFGVFGFCYNVTSTPVVLTGTTNNTTTITMTDTTGVIVGSSVSGMGIPVGATVVSINPNSSIVISAAATTSASTSLTFVNGQGLSLAQYQQAAEWNAAYTPNYSFKLIVPANATNVVSWAAAYPSGLGGIPGVALTVTNFVSPVSATSQYPEQCDAVIEAATNYNPGAINSVQNYMFQLFPTLTPLVNSDSLANTYDANNINYIGVTQNAGQQLAFYQTGVLQGGIQDPIDSGVYANEQWLKSALTAQIMSLLVGVSYIPANQQGANQILAIMQSVIQQALQNGTISVGKTLTALQIADITSVTGNTAAWQQVQNVGYYLTVIIQPKPMMPTVYQAVYTLVYSKNDVIRFVLGTDDLI